MNKIIASFLVSTLSVLSGCGVIWNNGPGGVSCPETDDFSTDTIGTVWQQAEGYNAGVCEYIITGGELLMDIKHISSCDNLSLTAGYDVDFGAVDQWACLDVTEWNDSGFDVDQPGVTFRSAAANSTSGFYHMYVSTVSNGRLVKGADGTPLGVSVGHTPTTAGTTFCFQVTGTGLNTVFSTWTNPTGSDPVAWGDPEWCLANDAVTTVGTVTCTDSAADFSDTNIITDTGNYMGVHGHSGNAENDDWLAYDNWSAGVCNTL